MSLSLPRTIRLALVALALASPLDAQPVAQPPREAPRVFSAYRFHMNGAGLVVDDQRFVWDADLGGDIDLLDFGRGRFNFLADVETILGEELRSFDPNQANYVLDFSGSLRIGSTEVFGVFHHVSRHLSDRPKAFPIDWNMVGVELRHVRRAGRWHVDARGRVLGTIKRSFVDYTSEVTGSGRLRYALGERTAILTGAALVWRGVDRDTFDRGSQAGGQVEAGVRLEGDAVAVELFVAVERRIDADPLDPRARTWALWGFRLLNRE